MPIPGEFPTLARRLYQRKSSLDPSLSFRCRPDLPHPQLLGRPSLKNREFQPFLKACPPRRINRGRGVRSRNGESTSSKEGFRSGDSSGDDFSFEPNVIHSHLPKLRSKLSFLFHLCRRVPAVLPVGSSASLQAIGSSWAGRGATLHPTSSISHGRPPAGRSAAGPGTASPRRTGVSSTVAVSQQTRSPVTGLRLTGHCCSAPRASVVLS